MLDTLTLRSRFAIPAPELDSQSPGDTFKFHGMEAHLATGKPRSAFMKQGWPLFLTAHAHEDGIAVSGPVRRTDAAGTMFRPFNIRLNMPRLAGVPDGGLPFYDNQLRSAFANAFELLPWLGDGWLDQVDVAKIDLCMNFALDPDKMLDLHRWMRHARIRRDAAKYDTSHRSLYWEGSQMTICLYDKGNELRAKRAKRMNCHITEIGELQPCTRLEFRLMQVAAARCLRYATGRQVVAAMDGGPPVLEGAGDVFTVKDITAENLRLMYRNQLTGFPDLPMRRFERLTIPTIVAIGMRCGWTLPDGRTMDDFYAQYASPRDVRHARKLFHMVDVGGPCFRWLAIVPENDWGPYAMATVLPPLPGIAT